MSNLHEQLREMCVSMKSKINYLSSHSQLGEFIGTKILGTDTTETLQIDNSQQLEKWISNTETIILNHLKTSDLNQYFSKMESFFKTKIGASTLIKNSIKNSSVIIQIILWSCISKTCNESIVRALSGCGETITIPQKEDPPTDKSLWKWVRGMAYCIRFAVFYSCRRLKASHGGSKLLDQNCVNLIELVCIEEHVKRTSDLFSIIGKNGLPLKSVTNAPSHEVIMKDIRVKFKVDHDRDLDMSSVAIQTYLNYMKSPIHNYILHKPKSDENGFVSDCDILSFMLNFEEIQNAHSAFMAFGARDVLKTLFDEPKISKDEVISTLLEEAKIRKDKTQDPNKLLTEVINVLSMKLEPIPPITQILDLGIHRMNELFGRKNDDIKEDLNSIKRFIIMSLCANSLVSAINKGTKDHCFYVLKRCFTDALIKATTKPTDGVMEQSKQLLISVSKQILLTVFNELSKTLLSDDHFMESYFHEISAKKKVPDGENEIWKTHFMDTVKLSHLTTILPIKRSTEVVESETRYWKNITQDMTKWATNSNALEEITDINKCAILNLCTINIKDHKHLTPIGGMCKSQQIMCHFINDALQKASSSSEGDKKLSKKINFVRNVLKKLSSTMFKDGDFIPAFCEMLAQNNPQTVYTDDNFWENHFKDFNWNNMHKKNSKIEIKNADIAKDTGDHRDQQTKRKHSTTMDKQSKINNLKIQKRRKEQVQKKKRKEEVATQHEQIETYNRFRPGNNLSKNTAPNHNVSAKSAKQQKKMEQKSSPKKKTTALRRSTRVGGSSTTRNK